MRLTTFFLLVLIILVLIGNYVNGRYDPGIKWKEISNKNFIVVFRDGYLQEAQYVLETAGEIYNRLNEWWGGAPRFYSRIRILVCDETDLSNGNATFFPFNRVEIFLRVPPPDSSIGSSTDWIRMVLSHELSHIFTFNWGSGFTYFLRQFGGTNPLLFPSTLLPTWLLEGIAVYMESRLNTGGRLNTPDYPLMLREIAHSGKLPRHGKIWGDPTSWPGPTAKYLYGSQFVKFLSDKYGCNKIPQMIRMFAHYPFPFMVKKHNPVILTIAKRFEPVFGKPLEELWNDFLYQTYHNANRPDTLPIKDIEFLDRSGEYNEFPVYTGDGIIYFVKKNNHEYPGIFRLNRKTGECSRIASYRNIRGISYNEREKALYFSASDYFKSFYYYSDIYRLETTKGKIKRLSDGERLEYPVKSSLDTENKLYCVKRVQSSSFLAELDVKTKKIRIISSPFDSMAFLSISPDNHHIAASIKAKSDEWKIGIFSLDGTLENIISGGSGKCYMPCWKNSDELFFIYRESENYRLASYRMSLNNDKSGKFQIYRTPGMPPLHHLSLFEEGQYILGSFFDFNGFNLGVVDISKATHAIISLPLSPFPQNSGKETNQEKILTPVSQLMPPIKSKHYNAFRDLFPKYFIANYRKGGNEYQPGIFMSGNDLVSNHVYNLQLFYGLKSKKHGIDFDYTFNGLIPSLTFRYSYLSDYNRTSDNKHFIYKEEKIKLQCLYPLRVRDNSRWDLYTDIHMERNGDSYSSFDGDPILRLNGFSAGLYYDSTNSYYDSFSLRDGMHLSLSYSRELKSIGSDYNIHTAAAQYRQYFSTGNSSVVAFRFGITDSWGEVGRLFYMGGTESKETYHIAGSNMFKMMRGFPAGYFTGTGGFLINLEYRISLWKIEQVLLLSRSIERLYLSLFTDIGNLWFKKKTINPSYSVGAELNLIAYFGDFKLNFSGGGAFGFHPYHAPMLYLRIGHSF